MNWGLFLALTGFLLPLALLIRIGFALAWAGRPFARPAQAARIVTLLLLAVPMSGKTPAMLNAALDAQPKLAAITEAFMVTPWGWAQSLFLIAAIGAVDWFGPRITATLDQAEVAPRYLGRDAAALLVCLGLAWIGAR